MKTPSLALLLLLLMALLLSTCQKPSRDNPWDELAVLDPQKWSPKNLQIEVPDITTRTLNWEFTGDNRIEGFKIDRKRGNENWVESYAKLGKETRSFLDTISPDQSTTYHYKVYAHVGTINSNILETSTLAVFPAPSDLTFAKINDVSYQLNWLDNSEGEMGFIIKRKTSDHDFIVLDTSDANITKYTDPNVFMGKAPINVQYQINAYYDRFQSDQVEGDTIAELSAPDNLQISRTSITSLVLTWDDYSEGEDGFRIYRKISTNNWTLLSDQQTPDYIDNSFTLNTFITYKIIAYYKEFISAEIEKDFISIIPTPVDITFNINSPTSITLYWNYPTTGIEGFQLERKTNEGAWTTIQQNIAADLTFYTDNQINMDQNAYAYRIRAFANNFFSDYIVLIDLTPTVINPTTGKIWSDRNLGASRVAQSSTDVESYGDLYQWGRGTDGHEIRTSSTTTTLSSFDNPGHGNFILALNNPHDWRSPQNNYLWYGVNDSNNPCPQGYRIPTESEWEAERQSWSNNNANGAFYSPLKLPLAGYRNYSNGSLGLVGSFGYYWSASVSNSAARRLDFSTSNASIGSYYRAYGYSIRCLKD